MRTSNILWSLFLQIVLAVTALELLFVQASPAPADNDTPIGVMPVIGPKSACHDSNGRARLGITPHPTNCALFINCAPHDYYGSCPVVFSCQSTLHYNFDKCYCDHAANATCYDQNNPEHDQNFFKCADPLVRNAE